MFEALLVDQNPHWQNNALYTAGKPRSIFPKLIEYLGVPHVISLIGVRRCGKSTLLKQLINYLLTALKVPTQNILFINL